MVTILLASYQGEPYLKEQLDSLLAQTCTEFRVIARDDRSSDGTWDLLREYERDHPDQFSAEQNAAGSGGAKYNFYSLMRDYPEDYVMLCDQDDVWLPRKVERSLAVLRATEKRYGKLAPLAVFSDMKVVDQDLQVLSPSYARASGADFSAGTDFKRLLLHNVVSGCTLLYNAALAKYFTGPPPEFFVMHDWWAALCAAAFGKLIFLDEPTMLYRQHGGNTVGAGASGFAGRVADHLARLGEMREALQESFRQAGSFLNRYRDCLSSEQVRLLESVSAVPDLPNRFQRWRTVQKLGLLRSGVLHRAADFLYL